MKYLYYKNFLSMLDNAEGITCPTTNATYKVEGTTITCATHGSL